MVDLILGPGRHAGLPNGINDHITHGNLSHVLSMNYQIYFLGNYNPWKIIFLLCITNKNSEPQEEKLSPLSPILIVDDG